MKIIFTSLPGYGHIYPQLPLALACAEAGHDVTFATGDPFLDALPVPTVRSLPATVSLHDVEQETARNHPDLMGSPEFAAHMFGETTARHTEPVLRALFERERPDVVIHEVTDAGSAAAAAGVGIQSICFGLGLWNPYLPRIHEIAGVDPTLPGGYLDQIPPSLQNPVPLPEHRQPIRPVAFAPPAPLPSWLPTSDRRCVYVTLGTVAFGAVEVLRRAILAVATHDVEVLVAAGPAGDPTLLGELPLNVHVEKFVPQAEVLRHVDLIVHHGGAGTMLGGLAEGLPQLLLPQGADQPFNAIAIARAGAGRALTNDEQTPSTLETAVGELLAEGPERLAAKRLAAEIEAMPAPSPALLEALLR